MVKLRSMVSGADKSGVNSTSNNDMRITSVGQNIRRYKLDELTQLWNVLMGDMSLVDGNDRINNQLQI
jgi:lipopolysaccharide/colanic/teichoic acid biosynthesis glycosyltransferase